MAEQSPQAMVVNFGVLTNAILPFWKVPDNFGGISLIESQVSFLTAGTAGLYLVDCGTAGTTLTGATLATYGGTAYTAKTPIAMTINNAYLAAGRYLGIKESNIGTSVTVSEVAISYKFGK